MAMLEFEYGTMGYQSHRTPNTMVELIECPTCRLYHVKGASCSHERVVARLPPSPQDDEPSDVADRKAKP